MARRKINAGTVDEIQKLAMTGLSQAKIAKATGVAKNTVQRYLADIEVNKADLDLFKANKGEVLEVLQKEGVELVRRIMRSVTEEDMHSSTLSQRASLMNSCNILIGTMFDKSRLHNGQSTANIQSLLVVAQKKVDELDVV